MPADVVRALLTRVATSPLVDLPPTLCWHAGEPLTVGLPFYVDAARVAREVGDGRRLVNVSIQTNGTLLNDEWVDFIKTEKISLGVSLDGPQRIHDAHRRTRGGHGTFARVMEAIELLLRHDVDFSVICVLTADSISDADELYQFFIDRGIRSVGFNIDEIEGNNLTSSAMTVGRDRFRAFLDRMFALWIADPARLMIREFEGLSKLLFWGDAASMTRSQSNEPFRIITVGHDGNFATYSPELFGRLVAGQPCWFGNVLRDEFHDIVTNPYFEKVSGMIERGVQRCASTCSHYDLCGGGSPSNKWFEHGSFEVAETGYCRLVKQEYIECAVNGFRKVLAPPIPPQS